MNFGMIILNRSIKTMQNYVTWIQTASLKLKMFMKILQMMLKNGCEVDGPLPRGMNKKVIGLFEDEPGGKIMIEAVALRSKTYSYLMDDGSEHKRAKGTKKCIIKTEINLRTK